MKLTAASTARAPRRDRGRAAPYRLVVLAPDTAGVVSAAGGLIADALRVGWRVETYLDTMSDARALQILGVDGRILPPRFDFGSTGLPRSCSPLRCTSGIARCGLSSPMPPDDMAPTWRRGAEAGQPHRLRHPTSNIASALPHGRSSTTR